MKTLLGSILVVLAVVIGLELWPGKAPTALEPDVRPPPQQATVTPAVQTNLDEAWVTTILGRPLFTPSRRPAAVAAVVTSPGARRPLPRLSGIVIDGERRSAIFAAPDQHRPVVVAEGGEIEGFRIEAIDANGVVLTSSGTRQLLRPSFDANAVAPPPPAPASPPPVAFNGPPGLSAMPKPPASPPASGPPGLPGLPSLSNLSGIPGLSPSQEPNPAPSR